jgi:hypothetical protein
MRPTPPVVRLRRPRDAVDLDAPPSGTDCPSPRGVPGVRTQRRAGRSRSGTHGSNIVDVRPIPLLHDEQGMRVRFQLLSHVEGRVTSTFGFAAQPRNQSGGVGRRWRRRSSTKQGNSR